MYLLCLPTLCMYSSVFSEQIFAMEDLVDKTTVSNEVLANVLRGLLYNVKEEDIFNTLDNCFSNDEVYEARKILVRYFFEIFENEEPNGRYMGPKEREIKKDENIFDIS